VLEGDTIFRAARTLHRALVGQTVTGFESVLPKLERVEVDSPLSGAQIVSRSKSRLLAALPNPPSSSNKCPNGRENR
jgi:endonuclease-8